MKIFFRDAIPRKKTKIFFAQQSSASELKLRSFDSELKTTPDWCNSFYFKKNLISLISKNYEPNN